MYPVQVALQGRVWEGERYPGTAGQQLPLSGCVSNSFTCGGQVILFAPLTGSQPAGFLLGKLGGPFIELELMDFVFCSHKIILLLKVVRIARFARNKIIRAIIS